MRRRRCGSGLSTRLASGGVQEMKYLIIIEKAGLLCLRAGSSGVRWCRSETTEQSLQGMSQ